MGIAQDIQKLAPGAVIELFELDATALGDTEVRRFHPGVNELKNAVVWQGQTYEPFPVEAEGFERSTSGTLPTPIMRVANVTGLIGSLCIAMGDLLGAKLIRKRTLVKYLDAVNFVGGANPTADPNAHFPDEVWLVSRKANENKILVELELGAATDVQGVMLPRRQVIANCCPWKYRGTECGYTDTKYFTKMDTATTDPLLDYCAKRLISCRLRHGDSAELPFGGFPSSGGTR